MAINIFKKTYEGFHISVKGSAHIKTDKECQDVSSHYFTNKFAIAVVCDGHGGEKHFRSKKGAEIACKVAIETIKEVLESSVEKTEIILNQLKKSIITKWNNLITEYTKNNPFTNEELVELSDDDRQSVENNNEIAYGTTMIASVLTNSYCFILQIGDGNCLVLNKEGNLFNPIPKDDRLIANITTSLCGEFAFTDFRHYWNSNDLAVALLVSTDGIRNSFEKEIFYENFCKHIIKSFNNMEYFMVLSELENYLPELTKMGSGDDLSIASVYNIQLLKDIINELSEDKENIEINQNHTNIQSEQNSYNNNQKIAADSNLFDTNTMNKIKKKEHINKKLKQVFYNILNATNILKLHFSKQSLWEKIFFGVIIGLIIGVIIIILLHQLVLWRYEI